jgi:Tol biopolymer transport system component
MQVRVGASTLIAIATALVATASASAAFPGSNGRIFFDVGGGGGAAIFSIAPDGGARERVVAGGREPAVSADGERIAYMRAGDLFTANRSGSDERRVTDTGVVERSPSFAPGGNRLVFSTERSGGEAGHIFTAHLNGTDRTRVTQSVRNDSDPSYSPNGSKIVFVRADSGAVTQLFKIDADGGNSDQLTRGNLASNSPTWSPDGSRIAFERITGRSGETSFIYEIDTDGGRLTQRTFESEGGDHEPSYSPSGNKIVFRGERNERKGLLVINAVSGVIAVERLTASTPGGGVGVDGDPWWGPTP